MALSFAPIKTSPLETYILAVGISGSHECSVGGIWGLKQLLNFEVTSGGGQAFPPDHSGMPVSLWGEAGRETKNIVKLLKTFQKVLARL